MHVFKECGIVTFPAWTNFWCALIYTSAIPYTSPHTLPQVSTKYKRAEGHCANQSLQVFQANQHASIAKDTGLSEHVIQEANKAAENAQKGQEVSEAPPVKKEEMYGDIQPRRQSLKTESCC